VDCRGWVCTLRRASATSLSEAAAYTAGVQNGLVRRLSLALILIHHSMEPLFLSSSHLVPLSGRVAHPFPGLVRQSLARPWLLFLREVFLLREFGHAGSGAVAACLNTISAHGYLYGRSRGNTSYLHPPPNRRQPAATRRSGLPNGHVPAGSRASLRWGLEIAMVSLFFQGCAERAPSCALWPRSFWRGLRGSYLSEKLRRESIPIPVAPVLCMLLLAPAALSAVPAALVTPQEFHGGAFWLPRPHFPSTHRGHWSALPPAFSPSCGFGGLEAGSGVSRVYVSNISGSVLGSLGIVVRSEPHFRASPNLFAARNCTVLTGGMGLVIARQIRFSAGGRLCSSLPACCGPLASHRL